MSPLRFLKWLVLLISLIRATVAHSPVRPISFHTSAQQHLHAFDDLANNFDSVFSNEALLTGNGNALPAVATAAANEIELKHADVSHSPATMAEFLRAERRQRAVQRLIDWVLWQQQKQQQQQSRSRRIENVEKVAFPLKQEQQKNVSATWQLNESAENSYPSAEISSNTNENNSDVNEEEQHAANSVENEYLMSGSPTHAVHNDAASFPVDVDKRLGIRRQRRMGFPYIPYAALQQQHMRSVKPDRKRAKEDANHKTFLPSISAGAMTHLGNFFDDLTKNVHFSEKSQLGPAVAKLMEGDHPLRMLHEKIAGEHEANAEFLHAIRSYRPSQKIRSLVSMNPRGYHGSQFIDPNYMWVGLGK